LKFSVKKDKKPNEKAVKGLLASRGVDKKKEASKM